VLGARVPRDRRAKVLGHWLVQGTRVELLDLKYTFNRASAENDSLQSVGASSAGRQTYITNKVPQG